MLRALYQFAKSTDMDPEQGKREKQRIESEVKLYRGDVLLSKRHADVLRETGAARAEYRKTRNAMGNDTPWYLPPDAVSALNSADRMVEVLDNISIERTENAEPNLEG